MCVFLSIEKINDAPAHRGERRPTVPPGLCKKHHFAPLTPGYGTPFGGGSKAARSGHGPARPCSRGAHSLKAEAAALLFQSLCYYNIEYSTRCGGICQGKRQKRDGGKMGAAWQPPAAQRWRETLVAAAPWAAWVKRITPVGHGPTAARLAATRLHDPVPIRRRGRGRHALPRQLCVSLDGGFMKRRTNCEFSRSCLLFRLSCVKIWASEQGCSYSILRRNIQYGFSQDAG